jgi:hypothetical protein
MGKWFLDKPSPTFLLMGFDRLAPTWSIADRFRLGWVGFYLMFLDGKMVFG